MAVLVTEESAALAACCRCRPEADARLIGERSPVERPFDERRRDLGMQQTGIA